MLISYIPFRRRKKKPDLNVAQGKKMNRFHEKDGTSVGYEDRVRDME